MPELQEAPLLMHVTYVLRRSPTVSGLRRASGEARGYFSIRTCEAPSVFESLIQDLSHLTRQEGEHRAHKRQHPVEAPEVYRRNGRLHVKEPPECRTAWPQCWVDSTWKEHML